MLQMIVLTCLIDTSFRYAGIVQYLLVTQKGPYQYVTFNH